MGPGAFGRMSAGPSEDRPKSEMNTVAGGRTSWANPTGRVSVQLGPGAVRPILFKKFQNLSSLAHTPEPNTLE